MVQQRVRGFPLEQIVGWAEFADCGLPSSLGIRTAAADPAHLSQALGSLRRNQWLSSCVVVRPPYHWPWRSTLPQVELYATDIDPAAVRCARRQPWPAFRA